MTLINLPDGREYVREINDFVEIAREYISNDYAGELEKYIKNNVDEMEGEIEYYKEELENAESELKELKAKIKFINDNYDKLNIEDVTEKLNIEH